MHKRRHHADRLPVRDRHARARVEDVAIAAAPDLEEPLVIAARRDRAVDELHRGDRPFLLARMLDADPPWRAVRLRPDRADIASEIDESVRDPVLDEDRRHPVGGVFLADAAEIDFHPGARQPDRVLAPLDLRPADQRERVCEHLLGRQLRRLPPEIPGAPQHPRREIEKAAALRVAALRVGEQRRGFGVDRDRRAAGGAIDARREAVVAIARILGLDALDIGNRGGCRPLRARGIGSVELHVVLRRHRAKRKANEGHRGDLARAAQNVFVTPKTSHRAENGSSPGLPPPMRQLACCR